MKLTDDLNYLSIINERLKEIDDEIAKLYQERRFLEMQQQEEWRRRNWTGPITATVDDDHTKIYFSERNVAFDDEWSGTLGD